MAKQRKFLVLDTETATLPCANYLAHNADEKKKIAIAKPLVYDLGYTIVNASGKTLKKVNFLIEEIYNNIELFQTAYYAWKRPIYEEMLKNGEIQIVSWITALRSLEADLQDVEITAAANACFDFKKAIPFTGQYVWHLEYDNADITFEEWMQKQEWACIRLLNDSTYGKGTCPDYLDSSFTLFKKQYPLTDIWTLACEHLAKGNKFKYFCMRNDKFTNSALYFSSTVETVFQYFTKDVEFNEKHTALDDAEIEAQILVKLIKAKSFHQTIEAFPFRILGTTADFAKTSPKYRDKVAKALKVYIDKNNGWGRENEGYWARILNTYDNL